jgi:D-serine deaminase-like pyridoxal phosphate-dependent protein
MANLHPNSPLIGQPGSRAALDTPALLVDVEALDRNIARMAEYARTRGVALRPHAKTHKSVAIAERQIAAGAVGICCATLGEAETMVHGGIPGVHITSPQVTAPKVARLVALNMIAPGGLSVVVDHPDNLAALDAAAQEAGTQVDVLVDFSAGHGRTGCADAEAVLALTRAAASAPGLTLRGIQSYSGNLQHIGERAERQRRAAEQRGILRGVVQRVRDAGIAVDIITGAGTGTHDLDGEDSLFTELQVGSYVFMDVDYHRALIDGSNAPPFETALFVSTAVVSANASGYVTTDAGLKCFATDGPAPEVATGAPPGSRYQFFGDEHGRLILPDGAAKPPIGTRIECVTPHCDPTVNLHDAYHVVRGDTLIDIWPVDARGKR